MSSLPILINKNQKNNKLLQHLNVHYQQEENLKPDYAIGTTCVLFLSLEYHSVYPEYISKRLANLGSGFRLRILLVETAGIKDPSSALKELTLKAMSANVTVVVSTDEVDSAAYLRQLKALEKSTSEPLEGKQALTHNQQFVSTLTKVRVINNSDALVLGNQFGSMRELLKNTQSLEELTGFGKTKSTQLLKAINDPFKGNPIM